MNTIKVIEVPTETIHYVRQSFTGQWHIAVGHGRKPSGKTVCGIKRDGYWADTSLSMLWTVKALCSECSDK